MSKVIQLYCGVNGSDKVYYMDLVEIEENKWNVEIAYGRRGAILNKYSKFDEPVSHYRANKFFEKQVSAKLAKDYDITYTNVPEYQAVM